MVLNLADFVLIKMKLSMDMKANLPHFKNDFFL